jgi:hypothetical protein
MSSITVLSEVPGETNFRKSRKVFSFSIDMVRKRCACFYMLCGFFGILDMERILL